ncbi:LLM class F420-dependent oxidoreductase [Phytoactinopolyspora halotolerans]|uniref:LLM class F420-dependent oxidoreductase n=1 Tax=Phytoactinopolyspora halotolerans TaxID=1981512 RepID=A0A6L9SJ45_9ACTN|nr:LLM class F420-dependent oxidoreductase [Phytoactinopolyspora halotolerans]NEE04432.1 LLM class F420-dependent oxidoreductase [Phytoactinopolyspora halotolerans]
MTASHPLHIGVKLSQQLTTIDELTAFWQTADEAGFDHLWNYDHFAALPPEPDVLPGDVFEAWTLLGAMAQATERIRIGCMVTGNTYRHPAVLAKMAVTVDHLSAGRLEFGLGAAWVEEEHTMLGIEFGTLRERIDRFEEACQVVRALWTEERATFDGRHYRLSEAYANPKPVQRPYPPIWVGGRGRQRTLRIAAQYADVWNVPNADAEEIADLSAVLDRHCDDVGRDPEEIRRSSQLRFEGSVDELVRNVDQHVSMGISEIIVYVPPGNAVADLERIATALPRLR